MLNNNNNNFQMNENKETETENIKWAGGQAGRQAGSMQVGNIAYQYIQLVWNIREMVVWLTWLGLAWLDCETQFDDNGKWK